MGGQAPLLDYWGPPAPPVPTPLLFAACFRHWHFSLLLTDCPQVSLESWTCKSDWLLVVYSWITIKQMLQKGFPLYFSMIQGRRNRPGRPGNCRTNRFRRILLLFKSRKSLRMILMCQPQSTKLSSVCRASLPVSVSFSYYILCIYTTELTTCNSRRTHSTPPSLLTTTRDSHPVASHVSCKLCL